MTQQVDRDFKVLSRAREAQVPVTGHSTRSLSQLPKPDKSATERGEASVSVEQHDTSEINQKLAKMVVFVYANVVLFQQLMGD